MADVKQIELNGVILDVKDATARADLSTLSGVVATKVPNTRTVNNKALSADITVNAVDVPYSNGTSGLSATNAQAALDEIASRAVRIIPAKKDVSANSTNTLRDLNVIPNERAFYFAALQSDTGTSNCAAAYILWYNQSAATFNVTPIFEGSGDRAPRITSSGVLKLNTTTSSVTVRMVFIRMAD